MTKNTKYKVVLVNVLSHVYYDTPVFEASNELEAVNIVTSWNSIKELDTKLLDWEDWIRAMKFPAKDFKSK